LFERLIAPVSTDVFFHELYETSPAQFALRYIAMREGTTEAMNA